MPQHDDIRSGRVVKPYLGTAGDETYAAKRRALIAAELRRRFELFEQQRARILELERWREEKRELDWAREWIRDHGGTVAAALKRTHPDTGGTTSDFMLTQRAREILDREDV